MTPREHAHKLFKEVWFRKEDKQEIISLIETAIAAAIADAIAERDDRWQLALGHGLEQAESNAQAERSPP